MLNIASLEVLLVIFVAFLVLKPSDFMLSMRFLGNMVRKIRVAWLDVRFSLEEAMSFEEMKVREQDEQKHQNNKNNSSTHLQIQKSVANRASDSSADDSIV